KHFREAVDDILSYMQPAVTENVPSTIFLPNARSPAEKDLLLLAPVQVPLYDALSPSRSTTLTPTKINQMNSYLHQLSADHRAEIIWSYSLMNWQRKRAYEESGLHVVGSVASRQADVLLNLRCNALAASSGQYPFDRTCCSNYNRPGLVQWAMLLLGLGILPFITFIAIGGASKILWIYEIIRLLVASYLFMTGSASVLVRLNLLSALLPYIMRTNYLFYYFAPLVTFWFAVIYFTMRIGRSRNDSTVFLFSKVLLSAMMVTALTIVPGILEKIFLILRITCHIHWNVVEWRFRVFLDMFIVYVGMLAGVIYVRVLDSLQKGRTDYEVFDIVAKYLRLIRVIFVMASLVIPPAFWALTRRSPNKYDYNWWQPYISPLPVLSYMILRNSNRHFRNYHSWIFAWLGKCSLETFTLQYHIWLAGDTKGLLRLGILDREGSSGRLLDFVLLTPIFLWVSWHTASATTTLTKWIIDPREGRRDAESETTELDGHFSSPRLKSEEAHPSNRRVGRRSMLSFVGRLKGLIEDDLKTRLFVMLAVLWVLNWTYT
ncbi:MAG: hypothetical protein Q9187_007875, partial [Circinaria calcarea]